MTRRNTRREKSKSTWLKLSNQILSPDNRFSLFLLVPEIHFIFPFSNAFENEKFRNFIAAIVIVFIICYSFIQIPSVYHDYQLNVRRNNNPERVTDWEHKDLIQTLTEISQIMVVFNSSVNFYVYFIKLKIKQKNGPRSIITN